MRRGRQRAGRPAGFVKSTPRKIPPTASPPRSRGFIAAAPGDTRAGRRPRRDKRWSAVRVEVVCGRLLIRRPPAPPLRSHRHPGHAASETSPVPALRRRGGGSTVLGSLSRGQEDARWPVGEETSRSRFFLPITWARILMYSSFNNLGIYNREGKKIQRRFRIPRTSGRTGWVSVRSDTRRNGRGRLILISPQAR